jgi:cytochrome c oxidase subunit 2
VGRPTLRSHETSPPAPGRRAKRGVWFIAAAAATTPLLSGCSANWSTGLLPSTKDTTNQTGRIIDLWNGSWIAALAVGALTWGLMLWCVVAYRRRRDETGLPVQIRYNLPVEILYTIVPVLMLVPLFVFTAKDQAAIADTTVTPDLTIEVVGKRWSWDFNYVNDLANESDDYFDTGLQAELDGKEGVESELPVLYLPVNERVQFILRTRDVNHSFWIPAFLYKEDLIAGVTNEFQVIPQKIGEYQGKCAELCGEYHSEMLFNVKVVTRADYDQHMKDLAAIGQTGTLDSNAGLSQTREGDE